MFNFPNTPVAGTRYQYRDIWWAYNGWGWQQYGVGELTELIPAAMMSGDPPAELTVLGTMFAENSQIVFGVTALTTTYVGPTELRATVDPAVPPGNVPVSVRIDQTTLKPLNFVISSQPVPTLVTMTPVHGMQGGSHVVQLIGSNFRSDSAVLVDNVAVPFTYLSATELTATITAPPKGNAKTSSTVRVDNDGASSGSLTFSYDTITVTRVSTNPVVTKMNEPMVLTVNGTNFSAAEKITANGVELATTFVSAIELSANYTPPYVETSARPPPLAPWPINVTGSVSPNLSINLTDPRAYIRSCYPDLWSEWFSYINDIEVWCWGPIGDGQNGLPMSIIHVDGAAVPTKFIFNVVSTESILEMNIGDPSGNDRWVQLTVVNDGKHTGPQFAFEYDFIG